MADLLTVLQQLGESVNVEERWIVVGRVTGIRHPFATLAEAQEALDDPEYLDLKREVRLASKWAEVDE